MKNFILVTALLTSLASWALPVLSLETNTEEVTSNSANLDSLSSLVNTWNKETDLLKKSEIAKDIQEILGLKADGIVGRKTIAALKTANVITDFEKLTRTQIIETRILIGVSEGKITQDQASSILSGRTQIKEINEKVKSGDLTKQEARNQIATVRETMPSRTALKEVFGGGKRHNSKKPSGQKNNGGGKKKN